MKTHTNVIVKKTPVIARNEAISELCRLRRSIIVLKYLPGVLVAISCLFLSVQALAQSGDTTHKSASKPLFTAASKNDPLIILDDVVYKRTINSINPDDINDITVLKGASATALYGTDAAMGAIVIKTKKYVNAMGPGIAVHAGAKVTWLSVSSPANKPLIVLNGEIYNGDIKSIDPATLQSIDVLTAEKATAIYGNKAAMGAIILKTKTGQKTDTDFKIKE